MTIDEQAILDKFSGKNPSTMYNVMSKNTQGLMIKIICTYIIMNRYAYKFALLLELVNLHDQLTESNNNAPSFALKKPIMHTHGH